MLNVKINHAEIFYDEKTLRDLKLSRNENINKLLKIIIDETNEKKEFNDKRNSNFDEKLKVRRL